ncbi:MAG: hypothetical protein ACKVU0_01145 [Saprospiraceae bacterium]
MARLLAAEGKTDEALRHVEDVLQTDMPYHRLADDPDLALLRESEKWKALMKKYFPDLQKD